MPTYLITWNPKRWEWTDLAESIREIGERGEHHRVWSCGSTKRIREGDRVFLLRQGVEPRGIVGAGWVERGSYEDENWNPDSTLPTANYVDVIFTELLDASREPILELPELKTGPLAKVNWGARRGGVRLTDEAAALLEELWRRRLERMKDEG